VLTVRTPDILVGLSTSTLNFEVFERYLLPMLISYLLGGSSTIVPAVIWFPGGTYLISTPLIQYYNTQFLGDVSYQSSSETQTRAEH